LIFGYFSSRKSNEENLSLAQVLCLETKYLMPSFKRDHLYH